MNFEGFILLVKKIKIKGWPEGELSIKERREKQIKLERIAKSPIMKVSKLHEAVLVKRKKSNRRKFLLQFRILFFQKFFIVTKIRHHL